MMPRLADRTSGPTRAYTVLVVSGNPDAQAMILEHAREKGHSVISASTASLGLSTFEMTQPDIVFVDVSRSEQDGTLLVKQICERRPTCSVVLLTDAGLVASTMDGLRAGALDYVQQPIHLEKLAHVLQRAIQRLPATVDDAAGIERLEYHLVMAPDPNSVEHTVRWLIYGTAMGLVEMRQLHLRSALYELVMNAVEHGCLEVRYHDKIKAVAADQYDVLIQRRKQDARFRDRRVTIRAIYDKPEQLLTYHIADEGKGFSWRSPENAGREACPTGDATGRGIFLARSFFPDLAYNDLGNEVTIRVPLG